MKKFNLKEAGIRQHSTELQQECVDNLDNKDVYIVHNIEIEILEKLDYQVDEEYWTLEDKQQINKIQTKIGEAIQKIIYKELAKNENLGLMKCIMGIRDYKSDVRLCREMEKLGGHFERLDDLKKIFRVE